MTSLNQKKPEASKVISKRIELDFETYSELDVSDVGPYVYANHPSTRVICVAYKIDGVLKQWIPEREQFPYDLHIALVDQKNMFIAHNILFEYCIWTFCLKKHYPQHFNYVPVLTLERIDCSASLARSLSLPGKLEDLALVVNKKHQKDMIGHKAMLKASKPDRYGERDDSFDTLHKTYSYNLKDVLAENEAFEYCLPYRKQTPIERAIFELDLKINLRGFAIDEELLNGCLKILDSELKRYQAECPHLSKGFFTSFNQTAKVMDFCGFFHYPMQDLQKATVQKALLDPDIPYEIKQILELRQATSKSSTKKLYSFRDRCHEGRIRDILVYHGASTGRWSGSGVQPQNFPRGTIKDVETAIEIIKTGDIARLKLLYGPHVLGVLSSCLRGMIVASKGKALYCADYAQIEARVLFWLAGETKGLTAFAEGRDIYKEMAVEIYGIALELINELQRQLGKQAVLGAGYNMGAKKFKITCEGYGMTVTEELAETAIQAYREYYSKVPKLWKALENAAYLAIKNSGKKYTTANGRVAFYCQGDFLFCDLPSGRRLAYHKPGIEIKTTSWGSDKPTIFYHAVSSKTNQYQKEHTYGGKLTENIVQAISRDLMAYAMLECEKEGYEVLLTVHDELLTEKANGELGKFEEIMKRAPKWAEGIPLKAEAWTGSRYRK